MVALKIEKKEQILIADCEKSVDEVYLDIASCILVNDPHPWTALSCVDHATNSPSLSGQRLSWVPRWDEEWSVYYLGYPPIWYRARGSLVPSKRQSVSAIPSHRLKIRFFLRGPKHIFGHNCLGIWKP